MTGPNQQFVIVFQQKGPLRCVELWCVRLRLDRVVAVQLRGRNLPVRDLVGHRDDDQRQQEKSRSLFCLCTVRRGFADRSRVGGYEASKV